MNIARRLTGSQTPVDYWRIIFQTVPVPILIVNPDVQVLDFNRAAEELVGKDPEVVLKRKGGEVLHCVHSYETAAGCGGAPACQDCVVRQAVGAAVSGAPSTRIRAVMEKNQAGKTTSIQLLVTSALLEENGEPRILLMLEDITELTALKGLLPICARCKKIRDDKRYWHQLEAYCHEHLSLDFTHSICPECAKELYSNV